MHPPKALSRGLVTFSIELEESRRGKQLAEDLAGVFAQQEIPATWCLPDPGAGLPVSASSGLQELAILGDASWSQAGTQGRQFAQALLGRLEAGRQTGVPVTSLICSSAPPQLPLEFALQHGITAVRGPFDGHGWSRTRHQPRAMRYGMWHLPASLHLPGSSRWSAVDSLQARVGIDRAAQDCRYFQIVLDVPRLAVLGGSAMRMVERIVHHAVRRRELDRVQLTSMAKAAASFSYQPRVAPSRSILRAA